MTAPTTAAGPPHLTLGGREVPVLLPTWGDPRLKLAVVLLTVQVLGQTVLDFKLSIAQILVTILTGAVIEVAVTYRRDHVLAWPASAMLTANSVALLLRTTGTQHGDWWSLNGIHFFVAAVVLALGSKYLLRPRGRHRFNPSNVALVWILLVVGPTGVFPQYLYWGPLAAPVLVTVAVLVVGAVWVLRPLGMLPMVAAYFATLGVLVGVSTLAGGSFFAIWHPTAVEGAFYWVTIVASPETMVFAFFMMSDPVTAPRSPRGRLAFGVLTAAVGAGLLVFQPTEFGVKLAILASLTVTCALVPMFERWAAHRPQDVERHRGPVSRPVMAAVLIVAVAAPVNTAALADDPQLILIERGVSGIRNPQ